MNFLKFLRTPPLQNTYERLLLKRIKLSQLTHLMTTFFFNTPETFDFLMFSRVKKINRMKSVEKRLLCRVLLHLKCLVIFSGDKTD